MSRLAVLLAVLAVVALAAVWRRSREGRLQSTASPPISLRALGVPPGVAALVEFTAPHCAPCTAARRILDQVAARHSVAVVPVDVSSALDLARAHHVLRTPTTFVVAADGSVHGRVSGVPDPADLARLLASMDAPGHPAG
ncbi:MAG: thioredoxin family protein [Egibacteraceae bacterium]